MASQQKAMVNHGPTPKPRRPGGQTLISTGAIQTSKNHTGSDQSLRPIVPKRRSGPMCNQHKNEFYGSQIWDQIETNNKLRLEPKHQQSSNAIRNRNTNRQTGANDYV